MGLIEFLIYVVKVFGLIFVIGFLFNIILDTIIINPIQNRRLENRRIKIMDILITRLENGEDISEIGLEEVIKEIEE